MPLLRLANTVLLFPDSKQNVQPNIKPQILYLAIPS